MIIFKLFYFIQAITFEKLAGLAKLLLSPINWLVRKNIVKRYTFHRVHLRLLQCLTIRINVITCMNSEILYTLGYNYLYI